MYEKYFICDFNGSCNNRCRFNVLQKSFLGTTGGEHWNCLSFLNFLFYFS